VILLVPLQTWGLPGHIPGELGSAACHGSAEMKLGPKNIPQGRASCLLRPCASRQSAGNTKTAPVQGGLWTKKASSRPRALLLPGFRLSPAQKSRLHLRNSEHSLLSGCYRHKKGDRDLNPGYSVLLFKTRGLQGQGFTWGWNRTGVGSGLPSWKVLWSANYTSQSWYLYFSQSHLREQQLQEPRALSAVP